MERDKNFNNLLVDMGFKICDSKNKFPKVGTVMEVDTYDLKGYYWYYETEDYILDVHDFIVLKNIQRDTSGMFSKLFAFCCCYIVNGSCLDINNNKIYSSGEIMSVDLSDKNDYELLSDVNSINSNKYYSVCVSFKHRLIKNMFNYNIDLSSEELKKLFENNNQIITPISKIAKEIINCKMEEPSINLYFDAKVKEWLSLYIEAYYRKQDNINLTLDDEKYLDNIVRYISNHYMVNIPHIVLERIACMSSTSLKIKFKSKYHMSITEYIQRYRINIAENLIKTTNLDIKSIAKSVGYKSHSRFSSLFKKYKGIYPKDVRKN